MRDSARYRFFVPLALCGAVANAHAQNAQLPAGTVPIETVTASYVRTPIADTPASVTVITAAALRQRGVTTLVQALDTVPGLNVVQLGGPGAQTSVFIDGTNSEDVLVLRDGVPVNDPSVANGAFNFGNAGIGDIARIVVVRGPMSSLYGSGAIGGVINLISKRGHGAPHVDYDIAGGFPGQGEGSVTLSGQSGKFDYAITGSLIEQAGFDATARRLAVYAAHRDPFRYKLGAVNLGYTPIAGTRISLIVRARQTGTQYPDLGYPIFDDPYENSYDSNVFVRFGVKSHLFDNRLTTELDIAHIQDDRRYLTLLDPADPNQFAGDSGYRGDRTVIQWNNVIRLPNFGPMTDPTLVAGIETTHDTAIENYNASFGGFPYLSSLAASQSITAGHVGAQATIARRLSVQGAIRGDSVSGYGTVVTERGGLVLALPEIDTRLKASAGSGFLAPSLYDLHGIDSYGYHGNPNLHPEHSVGYRFGFETVLPAFGMPDAVTLQMSYFHQDIANLFQYTSLPDGTSTEENVARARIHGIEAGIGFAPTRWLSGRIDYTRTIARDVATRTALLRRPDNAGSLTLSIHPIPALSIEPAIRYVGRFSDYLYANSGYPTGTGLARPGTIANLAVNYRVSRALTLFAIGRNLTNSPFEPANGVQIPGQNFLFGLRGTIGG
ncbi:MAG TPA: TonB-dependent receptor [Acidiphilium sp.]|jgi:vitamin B12 transporter|uniref:TonB-dependent receptor plug domain-containing protein n=1 Tax=unclassified Acidiphilium TaxID=2617493 RepID=UPI000BCC13D7|nr:MULTISPECIES: TonB-dependent receptor [unclassified Acidiphilium]OYV56304.1 MAG: ligand-gated channel protein [Acidiphilium sp. 20-67-58]HQT61099.1 TonB-dependent receptor [Acidiphilium sp.]HQU10266.1 TonB-dependent receptor [Acidiphilium sp.]